MKTTLGEKIKKARTEAKLSQLQLGVALKVSDKTISGYESNRISPPIDKMLLIAELLKKPVRPYVVIWWPNSTISCRR